MMPQTVFGQTDALALAVVAWLTANEGDFVMPIIPQRRYVLLDQLPDVASYGQSVLIDVFPDGESSVRQGISTAFASTYSLHLVLRQRLTGAPNEEDQCALLTQLRSQVIEGIKLMAFDLTNAVHPVIRVFLTEPKSTDMRLYSMSQLVNSHVYESDTILTFRASV